MVIKSRFKNGAFMPIDRLGKGFREDEVVEIEVRQKKRFSWRGALKEIKETSVSMQHKIRDMW